MISCWQLTVYSLLSLWITLTLLAETSNAATIMILNKAGKKIPVHDSDAELLALKALTKSFMKKKKKNLAVRDLLSESQRVRSREIVPDSRNLKLLSLAGGSPSFSIKRRSPSIVKKRKVRPTLVSSRRRERPTIYTSFMTEMQRPIISPRQILRKMPERPSFTGFLRRFRTMFRSSLSSMRSSLDV